MIDPQAGLDVDALIARQRPGFEVLQDMSLQKLSYAKLLLRANVLADEWQARLHPDAARALQTRIKQAVQHWMVGSLTRRGIGPWQCRPVHPSRGAGALQRVVWVERGAG